MIPYAGKARRAGRRWTEARKRALVEMWNAYAAAEALYDEFDMAPHELLQFVSSLRAQGFALVARRAGERGRGLAVGEAEWDEASKARFVRAWNYGLDMALLDERFGFAHGGSNALARKLRAEGYVLDARRERETAS